MNSLDADGNEKGGSNPADPVKGTRRGQGERKGEICELLDDDLTELVKLIAEKSMEDLEKNEDPRLQWVTVEYLLLWTFNSHWSISYKQCEKEKDRKIITVSFRFITENSSPPAQVVPAAT
ncbi:hypothetical protein WN51_07941 [Melipona quadrifasciata]|uniref:Uncharacterized protein n=1 Tax=Melipona quadrifasciata TaxID=166423 RepID=A0A0M8ZNP2_9HYME|nr:hypothetical protein WN51_07941 [Melipona quadrifasciata]